MRANARYTLNKEWWREINTQLSRNEGNKGEQSLDLRLTLRINSPKFNTQVNLHVIAKTAH